MSKVLKILCCLRLNIILENFSLKRIIQALYATVDLSLAIGGFDPVIEPKGSGFEALLVFRAPSQN